MCFHYMASPVTLSLTGGHSSLLTSGLHFAVSWEPPSDCPLDSIPSPMARLSARRLCIPGGWEHGILVDHVWSNGTFPNISSMEGAKSEDSGEASALSLAEVSGVVMKLCGRKAPGIDEVCPEMLKALDIWGLSWLTRLFSAT